MSAIPGLLGLGGGQSGTGVAGPALANITNPTNAAQTGAAYGGVQNSLQSQQSLLAALQGQNGLGNQNQVYGQLQGVANGTGPNPAQAMLNNATGANVANQAALMAGQRGAGANAGLIARQAGQQGAATQQNAIGQGAALQAQQSLGALGQAGALANQQAGQQIGQTNANVAGQQGEQANLLGAQGQFNNAQVSSQNSVNSVNGQLANTDLGNQNKAGSGLLNGLGGVGSILGIGSGSGSPISADSPGVSGYGPTAPGFASGIGALVLAKGGAIPGAPVSRFGQKMANGGKVPAMVSPGERYLNPDQAREVAMDKSKAPEVLASAKKIPGQAKVKGDSEKNDTVPATLETGGVVVPRTKANMPADAARFIEAALSKKSKK
jgi:hypothetical protein